MDTRTQAEGELSRLLAALEECLEALGILFNIFNKQAIFLYADA